ncbi:DUF3383 family protein [Parablautia intestinalis]|uniref:DUF3383 family protein n=1 Tax=Parablautia intestinalis TaxID=2320100 RepID=A0A3A9AH94_9FIRM|nr:DUF3383 family protein [Parablautia intestinalis]RKI90434.1 DUF3383 family protein [Parablautia intestinalis]
MSEILDNIVNCNISIEAPVEDGASFGVILIVGDAPLKKGKNFKDTDKYASIKEIIYAGWEDKEEVYQAALAAFGQEPKPQVVYVAARSVLESGDTEEFSAAVEKAADMPGWYGLALAGAEDEDYRKTAELIERTEKIFAFSVQDKENPLADKKYMRSFGIYSENKYVHIAWMAKVFSFDPGSETWAFKTLSGVNPSEITTSEMRQLEEKGLNYYAACAGRNITRNGYMTGGEWIDVIRFRDWLKNRMQIKIYELFIKNPKIPYTDSGIVLVENQMEAVLAEGQKTGGISETEYNENDEPVRGYTVTVPRSASLGREQRAKRVLTDCHFTARLSGAIHVTELRGNLTF